MKKKRIMLPRRFLIFAAEQLKVFPYSPPVWSWVSASFSREMAKLRLFRSSSFCIGLHCYHCVMIRPPSTVYYPRVAQNCIIVSRLVHRVNYWHPPLHQPVLVIQNIYALASGISGHAAFNETARLFFTLHHIHFIFPAWCDIGSFFELGFGNCQLVFGGFWLTIKSWWFSTVLPAAKPRTQPGPIPDIKAWFLAVKWYGYLPPLPAVPEQVNQFVPAVFPDPGRRRNCIGPGILLEARSLLMASSSAATSWQVLRKRHATTRCSASDASPVAYNSSKPSDMISLHFTLGTVLSSKMATHPGLPFPKGTSCFWNLLLYILQNKPYQ